MVKAFSTLALLLGLLLANCGGEVDDRGTGNSGSTPIATTLAATSITPTSALLSGTAIPNGLPTRSWFEYGEDSGLKMFTSSPKQDMGNGPTSLPANMTGYGFESILQNLLTASRGYPIAIENKGVGGVDSAYGAANISTTLSIYPQAKYYLVLYGTNDADTFFGGPVSRESYKNNMQTIVSAVLAAGKTPYLAKVPYTTNTRYSVTSIQEYNVVIDEIVAGNGITVIPPDFYALFQNTGLLDVDGLHPNGTGYQSLANLWLGALAP